MISYVVMIYPENRRVLSSVVIGWANDAIANGTPRGDYDGSLQSAIELLEDIGECTFSRSYINGCL